MATEYLDLYGYVPAERWERISRGDGSGVWMYPETLRDAFTVMDGPSRVIRPGADLALLPTYDEWAVRYSRGVAIAEDPVAEQKRRIAQYGAETIAWEQALRETEWGADPEWWRPMVQLQPGVFCWDEKAKVAYSPRDRLIAKYGTCSLVEYASSQGLPPPTLKL